jgi:thiamine biosynthesis protein ThiS
MPPGGARDRVEIDVEEGTTPFEVMQRLGFPESRTYLVILNDDLIPKAERSVRTLSENDELAILPPLKGG